MHPVVDPCIEKLHLDFALESFLEEASQSSIVPFKLMCVLFEFSSIVLSGPVCVSLWIFSRVLPALKGVSRYWKDRLRSS